MERIKIGNWSTGAALSIMVAVAAGGCSVKQSVGSSGQQIRQDEHKAALEPCSKVIPIIREAIRRNPDSPSSRVHQVAIENPRLDLESCAKRCEAHTGAAHSAAIKAGSVLEKSTTEDLSRPNNRIFYGVDKAELRDGLASDAAKSCRQGCLENGNLIGAVCRP